MRLKRTTSRFREEPDNRTQTVHTAKMKNRKLILILLLVTLGSLILIASRATRYDEVYESYKDMHIAEIKDKGVQYIESNEPDSALACFTIVISRYNENMSDSDKLICARAYNNAGYVYTLMHSDYATGYRNLLKSLEIAKSIGNDRQLSFIYINIGNIYIYFNDLQNAANYYMMAYRAAVDAKEWEIAAVAVDNILLTMRTTLTSKEILTLIDSFMHLDIPHNEMWSFTRDVCGITKDYLNGTASSDSLTARIDTLLGSEYVPGRYSDNLKFLKFEIMLADGKRRDVLNELKGMVGRDGSTTGDMAVMYKSISEVYGLMGRNDSARAYRYMCLEIQDSVMRQQNYAAIRDMHSSYDLEKFEKNIKDIETKRRNLLNIILLGAVWVAAMSVFITLLIRKNRRLREALTVIYNRNSVAPVLPAPVLPAPIDETQAVDAETDSVPEMEELPETADASAGESADTQQKVMLDRETRDQIAKEILDVMQDTEAIGKCEFTVRKLAETIGTKERYVSYVINECFNKNFNALLNEYRIAEAKRILGDAETARRTTIEWIATSLGFKSRSHFAALFKKETGLTPREYRQIAEQESSQKD